MVSSHAWQSGFQATIAVLGVLANISVIIAAWVAVRGINAWRREHIGKKRVDLAEEVLALFYEARDVIRGMRSPFTFGGEGSTRPPQKGETAEEQEARRQAFVIIERYNKNRDLFGRLHSLRYRFVVRFGEGSDKPFDDLHKVLVDLWNAARQLSTLWLESYPRDLKGPDLERHTRRVEEAEATIWEGPPDRDPIAARVDGVVGEIESICAPVIKEA